MSKEETQKKAQQKYMELQMIDAQLKQIQKQVQSLENQAAEMEIISYGLEEIKDIEKGNEILVPLANGIFAKAKIEDTNNLVVNVGSNTAVIKNIHDTKEMLASQTIEIRSAQEQLSSQFNQILQKAKEAEAELQKLIEQNV